MHSKNILSPIQSIYRPRNPKKCDKKPEAPSEPKDHKPLPFSGRELSELLLRVKD